MPTTRYTPDTFEQECICLLYKWLAENGFQNPDLPPIYLSFETPPQFATIPHPWHKIFSDDLIWDDWNGDDKQKKDFDDKLRKQYDLTREQIFSIDDVLGLYCHIGADKNNPNGVPEIVLYAQGITAVAKRLNVPTEMLRAVVLVHEIGHWISHAVPDSKHSKTWDSFTNFKDETKEAKVMWAQLFPYWVAQEVNDSFKQAFEKLNVNQASEYKTFEQFTKYKQEQMLTLLKYFHRSDFLPDEIDNKEEVEKYKEVLNIDLLKEKDRKLERNLEKNGVITKPIKQSGIF